MKRILLANNKIILKKIYIFIFKKVNKKINLTDFNGNENFKQKHLFKK